MPGLPHGQLNETITGIYNLSCCHQEMPAAETTDIWQLLNDIVSDIYSNKQMPQYLDSRLLAYYAGKLWQGITEGYGMELPGNAIDWTTPDHHMLHSLRNNVWEFSAAKTYTQLRTLSQALTDDEGNLRTASQFKKAAYDINNVHVGHWLKTEYNQAVAGAQMAGKWVQIQENKDVLSLLRYDAVMDDHTSKLCKGFDGILLHADDEFWDTYYPPNHFGCRSTVRSEFTGTLTDKNTIVYPEKGIPPIFRVNLAKQGLAFPPGHPYYDDLPNGVIRANNNPVYIKDESHTGNGEVHISGMAFNHRKRNDSRYLDEYNMRVQTAKSIANSLNESVYITPELNNNDWRFNHFFNNTPVPGKLPDFIIGGKYYELESYEKSFKYSNISNMLRKGAAQSDRVILKLRHNVDIANIIARIKGLLPNSQRMSNLKDVIILDKNNNVHTL